ncbi:hypothetical protein ES288_D09G070000v1 [Gossypium darwinii]|uniref:DRBM domain-containing protein n=1 Tax=Gossypium darwinii TaxID=34276 RepID=A0A5D2BBV0_GOSDA|nr:hypothetical protein ES288_D09G070000v1 [Gossypium darwinii]
MTMTKGLPEHLLHKTRLQEYAQKSGLDLPVYDSSSEGFPRAPRFKASVRVNQTTYTSIKQASAIKDKDYKQLTISTVYQDLKCCKSILKDYALRMNHASPTYTTTQQDKFHPVYVSSLVFDGKTYRGEVSGSKKEAKQLVVRIAIESLLGILLQIINSKSKAHNGRNTINGHSSNMINTRRPVLVGPSKQPVNVLGSSVNANNHNKRKLEGDS